ncbi:hypothetical protein R69749_08486 [Paraburkholderia domus]|nr:hypothetical protein R69749_08486 [Paraburkholderia domus]
MGQDPGDRTVPGPGQLKEGPQHGLAQSAMSMCRRKRNLVDPQLCRFVGVDIVNSRGKADDHAIVDRNSNVMTRVLKKFSGQFWIYRIVEYLGCNVCENVLVTAL